MRRRCGGGAYPRAVVWRDSPTTVSPSLRAARLPTAAAFMMTTAASAHCTARRHKSFAARVHDMTVMRLGSAYAPNKYTSKDVSGGPRAGVGHDPVYANYYHKKLLGPLQRKMSSTPDDFLNVDESRKWMDAVNAAKVLAIKEDELPTLTKEVLEERFTAAYRTRVNAEQEEAVVATEVLIDFLDSTAHQKKSRQHHRKFLDRARAEVDAQLTHQRQERSTALMWWFGIAMTGACVIVLFVAYSRLNVTRKDVTDIGTKTSEYFLMTFLQPKNTEPKPDYNTRYFNTPTAMELDERSGRFNKKFLSADEVRQAERAAAYAEQEDADTLKLFNDEQERGARERQSSEARNSRVAVLRREELDTESAPPTPSRPGGGRTAFEELSVREFSNLLASNFGGGSRFQRITDETSSRAELLRGTRERTRSDDG
ncbi:hypothetical protein NESM_000537900 [Novymonas esmeraldas]|uniref:Transmembrane protein n=1 Tax=Novymonas esmeraldas TaxID=1808958 RepID=A0AAW0ERB7_9TRYP